MKSKGIKKSSNRRVNRLDKIISRNLRSNEVLVSNVDSILCSIKTDSSVDRTSEDVPKPLTFVNVHHSRNDFSVVHRRLIALVDPGSTHSTSDFCQCPP